MLPAHFQPIPAPSAPNPAPVSFSAMLLCAAGALLSGVVAVPSAPLSYDAQLAATLWNASADVAGVPRELQIGSAVGTQN